MGGEQATALRTMRRKSNLPFELGISIDAAGVSCNACPRPPRWAARDSDREAVNNINTVFMMPFTLGNGNWRVSILDRESRVA